MYQGMGSTEKQGCVIDMEEQSNNNKKSKSRLKGPFRFPPLITYPRRSNQSKSMMDRKKKSELMTTCFREWTTHHQHGQTT
jgi:hypothetical protein